jgi:hypothetical protein
LKELSNLPGSTQSVKEPGLGLGVSSTKLPQCPSSEPAIRKIWGLRVLLYLKKTETLCLCGSYLFLFHILRIKN